jgi:CheY-like chemotaxis protein
MSAALSTPACPKPSDVRRRQGLRVLVMEDEALIALLLKEMLIGAGHTVVGPFSNAEGAIEALAREQVDAVVLDLVVQEEHCFSVPPVLIQRGIPFLIVTGAPDDAIPQELRDRPSSPNRLAFKSSSRLSRRWWQLHNPAMPMFKATTVWRSIVTILIACVLGLAIGLFVSAAW